MLSKFYHEIKLGPSILGDIQDKVAKQSAATYEEALLKQVRLRNKRHHNVQIKHKSDISKCTINK